jgi:osmoprotectant transport system ATP-binding protein
VPVLLGRSRKNARAIASELLERVGLPASMGGRYPAQLSGGQQQRIGVARALAADPPVMLMDEPFSAVDPVVRAQLQEEFTRLQAELGKTIVFVTHDIDEAVKLGDGIAVLAVGGRLAQYATPAEVLGRPADDFVADFVGRDRGYRALSFTAAGDLPVHPEPTLTLGRSAAADFGPAAASDSEPFWALVVDEGQLPRGWLDRRRLTPGRPVELADLVLGGSLAGPQSSLRTALDAALSSPSGRGVAVDSDGRVTGTVAARDVLDAIEAARLSAPASEPEAAASPPPEAGTAGEPDARPAAVPS